MHQYDAFEIGDRVECLVDINSTARRHKAGDVGTVYKIVDSTIPALKTERSKYIVVLWDGTLTPDNGWWVSDRLPYQVITKNLRRLTSSIVEDNRAYLETVTELSELSGCISGPPLS